MIYALTFVRCYFTLQSINCMTNRLAVLFFFILVWQFASAQFTDVHWSEDGNSFYQQDSNGIEQIFLPSFAAKTIVAKQQLTPAETGAALDVQDFSFSPDGKMLLIYTNSKKVWRYKTRGDYWVLNITDKTLKQLGKNLPQSSLMFAKFSPDGTKAAYVSGHNIYVEDVTTNNIAKLTYDGTDRMINGTFDWAYEEELDCRDGFRWSPDSKSIAYWKIDATKIPNFLMIDNTDSIYSFTVPVEYPKVGIDPSPCYLYVVNATTGNSIKMNVPGDAQQHYIPRAEWANNSNDLIIQQINRKQNESKLMYCNALTGDTREIYDEKDSAWIDAKEAPVGWDWLQNGAAFLWTSERDGWRHLYSISRDGKQQTLLTKGNYDVIGVEGYNEKNGYLYFAASPENATQSYLYRVKLDGKGTAEKLSPVNQNGTHSYVVSPNGLFAQHSFSNANTPPVADWVSLPKHNIIKTEEAGTGKSALPPVKFFTITTEDNVTMDGWMVLPKNFDSTKKYPAVFMVYTEPAAQTVNDSYGAGYNNLYNGSMYDDGYIYISLDGRGTPAPKGAAWRKAIYKNIGIINIRDQAMAAKKLIERGYIDTSRVAVWGWSGGGSTTLNLLFQYPEIYKTGIAIAPVAWQLCYDNIYQERYMGLPQEDKEPFVKGSPVTYAKNLQGHLLVIHGTGDDNVHYQNTEILVNELIKYNKDFRMMSYPNRTHAIREGEGTSQHLHALYTSFLKQYCPPGAK